MLENASVHKRRDFNFVVYGMVVIAIPSRQQTLSSETDLAVTR